VFAVILHALGVLILNCVGEARHEVQLGNGALVDAAHRVEDEVTGDQVRQHEDLEVLCLVPVGAVQALAVCLVSQQRA